MGNIPYKYIKNKMKRQYNDKKSSNEYTINDSKNNNNNNNSSDTDHNHYGIKDDHSNKVSAMVEWLR